MSLSLVEYQTAVLRGDMEAAEEILPTIPKEQRNRVASFLEGRGAHKCLQYVNTALIDINRLEGARAASNN